MRFKPECWLKLVSLVCVCVGEGDFSSLLPKLLPGTPTTLDHELDQTSRLMEEQPEGARVPNEFSYLLHQT